MKIEERIGHWRKAEPGKENEGYIELLCDAEEELNKLRSQIEELSNSKTVSDLREELEFLEQEHTEALLELNGYRNGTTEQEMRAVTMRFADLADNLMKNNNEGDDDGNRNSNKNTQEKNA